MVGVLVNLDNTEVTVNFNESMILYSGWNETDFNLFITGDQEIYNLSWTLRNASSLTVTPSDTFIFDIDIVDQMAGYEHERINIQFLNDEFLRASTTTLKLTDWTVSAYTHQHASKLVDQ